MKLIESFFWGIIAALGALILELVLFIIFSAYQDFLLIPSFVQFFSATGFLLAAVFMEEIMKYIIISKRIVMSGDKNFFANSLFVGLGFFSTELAFLSADATLLSAQIIIELAIIHAGTAGIIGYFVATRNSNKLAAFLYSIFLAIPLHASFNLLSRQTESGIANNLVFALLLLVVFVNMTGFMRINKALARD